MCLTNPREIIDINQDDVRDLEHIIRQERPTSGTNTKAVAKRTKRTSQSWPNPIARLESAMSASKKKSMRDFGACLPCLVNHEHVSNRHLKLNHSSRTALILAV